MRISFVGLGWYRLAARVAGAMLIVAALVLALSEARAQSAARGQALYAQLGCNSATCHGADPAANLNQLLNGANSAAAIEYAATTRSDMQSLRAAFDLDPTLAVDLAAWLATIKPDPPASPPRPLTIVFEYHHAAFGHYFATGIAGEIAVLDGGQVAGWSRTGRSFNAYAAGIDSAVPVCRFFTVAFAPKSSHFYTPVVSECEGLRSAQGVWQFEGETFWVLPADAAGQCPAGSSAVYRLYNNGHAGAPNHRYTTDAAVRSQMLAEGWMAEGLGPLGVIFCAPS